MKVIKAPSSALRDLNHGMKVFLAGSIEMGLAEDWQSMIPDVFKAYKNVIFLNPRRDDWDNSWEQKESSPEFNRQVNWELEHLDKADIIFLYLSPETKSPISLLELGLYADSKKIIVCCPDGFYRKGNVDIVCTLYDIPLYNRMDAAIGRLRTELKYYSEL